MPAPQDYEIFVLRRLLIIRQLNATVVIARLNSGDRDGFIEALNLSLNIENILMSADTPVLGTA